MCKLFKPKDWYPVWAEVGRWKITDYDEMGDAYDHSEICTFEILYSPSRGKHNTT